MKAFRLSVSWALPFLLLVPACGGEPAEEPAEEAAVEVEEAAAEPEAPLSDVPEAQAAYDESMELWSTDGRASLAKLHEAIQLDPEFLEAYATLSNRYARIHQQYDRSDSIAQNALTFAEQAMEMDPDAWASLSAMGAYHYRVEKDYPNALEIYSRGANLYPENTLFIRMQAHVARRAGDWDGALELLQRSEEMEPTLDAIQAILENHYYNRRWEEAAAAAREHAQRAPNSTLGPSNLAWRPTWPGSPSTRTATRDPSGSSWLPSPRDGRRPGGTWK
jgi:tetratricopeptide (TPR) repeat protein